MVSTPDSAPSSPYDPALILDHFADLADPRREQGRITVRDRGRPVADLNELEFVQGQLYANVWHTDRIAVIRLDTGDVSAWIDLAGLKPASAQSSEAVLNGIAYDAARDRLFVTGKWWPRLYEIRVRPRK